jgi:hypothetical protein
VVAVTETLAEVRAGSSARVFPVDVLDGCSTALVLFAAAFNGRNDAVHVAGAGLHATCVDVDEDRLAEMEGIYPAAWEFRVRDAFAFARAWRTGGRRWDVVTVDCPTNLFDRCAAEVELWCAVASQAVVLGCARGQAVVAPEGWGAAGRVERSGYLGGVDWMVLKRQGVC